MNSYLDKILRFLDKIGIEYSLEPITGKTFLPGLKLRKGILIVDTEKLLYPGDILHEAGHLATMPPEIRLDMSDDLGNNDLHKGGEMMAIAWSYAVCIELNIDPAIVFHEDGYKGSASNIVENFREGRFFGVPLLVWCGMTSNPSVDEQGRKKGFPKMLRWTCEKRPA